MVQEQPLLSVNDLFLRGAERVKLNALVKTQKEKCRCEDGKSVKGENNTVKIINTIQMPTYNWYCG